jgi:hypothetical protein
MQLYFSVVFMVTPSGITVASDFCRVLPRLSVLQLNSARLALAFKKPRLTHLSNAQ